MVLARKILFLLVRVQLAMLSYRRSCSHRLNTCQHQWEGWMLGAGLQEPCATLNITNEIKHEQAGLGCLREVRRPHAGGFAKHPQRTGNRVRDDTKKFLCSNPSC